MNYLAFIIVDGALTGVVYALFALAFVIVYRTARVINFALGEWAALGTVLVSFGAGTIGMHGSAAFAAAALMLVALAFIFTRVVLAPLIGQPVVAIVMVTLGLAATMRGAMALLFRGTPRTLPFELPRAPIAVAGIEIATARLLVATIAAATVAKLGIFLHRSRTGIALRALAADPQAAMVSGINVERYVALAWALAGVVCLAAGVLWTLVFDSGSLGLLLLGLKVLPIVVIGGLDSVAGSILAALLLGVVESLVSGYLGSVVGYGIGGITACAFLLVMLMLRPHGLLGRRDVVRV